MRSNKKNGGIVGGVLGGLILLVFGTVLLWWNEGENVRNIRTTDEVERNAVDIVSMSDPAQYENKLVSVSGRITVVDDALKDETFGISVHTAAMKRVVEMYQWDEEEHSDDDGTTYSYSKDWYPRVIDSSRFMRSGHDNPGSMPYENAAYYAEKVTLGNFHLSDNQMKKMSLDAVVDPSAANAVLPENYHVSGSYATQSEDLGHPQVGDVRISWQYNDWTEVSLIAQPVGTTFSSYVSKVGKRVNYITGGIHTTHEMVEDMREQDRIMKWAFRAIGALMIFFGYLALITPLTKLASLIPFLGGVINGLLFVIEFLIALVHSLLVIGIAWIRFRPVVGILLLAACAGVGVLTFVMARKRKESLAPATTYQTVS